MYICRTCIHVHVYHCCNITLNTHLSAKVAAAFSFSLILYSSSSCPSKGTLLFTSKSMVTILERKSRAQRKKRKKKRDT